MPWSELPRILPATPTPLLVTSAAIPATCVHVAVLIIRYVIAFDSYEVVPVNDLARKIRVTHIDAGINDSDLDGCCTVTISQASRASIFGYAHCELKLGSLGCCECMVQVVLALHSAHSGHVSGHGSSRRSPQRPIPPRRQSQELSDPSGSVVAEDFLSCGSAQGGGIGARVECHGQRPVQTMRGWSPQRVVRQRQWTGHPAG